MRYFNCEKCGNTLLKQEDYINYKEYNSKGYCKHCYKELRKEQRERLKQKRIYLVKKE